MAWWQAGQAPPYPPERAYKPFYCEENAYQLAAALAPPAASHNAHSIREVRLSRNSQDLYRAIWDAFVLVISNATKSVALWQQRASKLPESGHAVVWDYHVVFLLTCNLVPLSSPANKKPSPTTSPPPTPPPPRTWVYDRDSLLADEQPIPFSTYITQTFGPARQLPNHLRATFRLVPANEFLDTFASDRSHMRRKDGTWSAAPPEWPLIIGPQASSTNNLMAEFVDMSANRIGRVLADKHFFTHDWARLPEPGESVLGCTRDATRPVQLHRSLSSPSLHTPATAATSRIPPSRPPPPPPLPHGLLQRTNSTPNMPRRGGRISSPLFPAYMARAAQQRARE